MMNCTLYGLMSAIKEKIVKYKGEFIFGMLFSLFIYSLFITQQLTNAYDGFWRQNYDIKGDWELSLGRWMQRFVDMAHYGIHTDPYASITTLTLFVVGLIMILDIFEVRKKWITYLFISIFISSTLVSITLSYRIFSIEYGIAFVASVIAAYSCIKIENDLASMCVGGTCLCVMMALYQAYLTVFSLIVVFWMLHELTFSDKRNEECFKYVFDVLKCCMFGAALYLITLKARLYMRNTVLSDYHGADTAFNIRTVQKIPLSIARTYKIFFKYFWDSEFKLNVFQEFGLLKIFFILSVVVLIIISARVLRFQRENKVALLSFVLAVLAIPVACNVELMLATEAELQLHMTVGLALLFPMVLLLLDDIIFNSNHLKILCCIICAVLIYGNVLQVQIDQDAMFEGKNATVSMAYGIVEDLKKINNMSDEYDYFFVGQPIDNEYFYVSKTFYRANEYAQVGKFWLGGNCMRQTYEGLFNRIMGINLNITEKEYGEYSNLDIVKEMPSYPEEGYIKVIDNTVIVKISN